MKIVKKYLYPVAFSAMLFSSSAIAKVHPLFFKGVTRVFHKDKKFYSPTLGITGLQTGFIEGIRLSGPFRAAYKDGNRFYAGDTSSDPLWNVVNILFPSVNGLLGTEATADTNFGRYVKSPKTVALLINYTKKLREGTFVDAKKLEEEIIGTLTIDKKMAQKLKKGKTVNKLLEYIKDSIVQEQTGKSIYPAYTTEQAIQAFFCYQFNTQKDIWDLLGDLDDSIVNKTKLSSTQHELFQAKDVQFVEKKKKFNLDDVFYLSQPELFRPLIPYKEGISLLNNGNANAYDRNADAYIENAIFADCVEMAARHIMNLLFYNPDTGEFDLNPITKYVERNSPGNPYFKNVQEFYKDLSPLFANAGDIGTRSYWNRVFGDLPGRTYVKDNHNELETGFINLIMAFQTVFGVPLNEFPPEKLEMQKTWVKESLISIFTALNPRYTYDLKTDLFPTADELSGDIPVMVKGAEAGANLFSFNIYSLYKRHSEINKLQLLQKRTQVSPLRGHLSSIHPGTSEESLWLLDRYNTSDNIHHPLYKLYSQPLADNYSRKDFLEALNSGYESWAKEFAPLKENLPLIQMMIENVLTGISWEDPVVVKEISKPIFRMLEKVEFQEQLFDGVKGLALKKQNNEKTVALVSKFKKLEFLDLSDNSRIERDFDLTDGFQNIRKLNLSRREITKLTGLENLSNIEELDLKLTRKLTEFVVSAPLERLERIYLSDSGITEFTGFENLPNLKELRLKHTRKLTELVVSAPVERLERVYLSDSGITKFMGLENLSNVKVLKLEKTKKLGDIAFTQPFKRLEGLYLKGSGLSQLTGLGFLENLKELDLQNTPNLKTLKIERENKDLVLKLHGSGIKRENIEGIEFLDEGKIHF
ncbi:MAG: hypothetical protein BGO67_06930 [Alphaproteobacteria bacterium 41-28]|nr:MAG: hypothetical protein BGO67_06930 [Alphaproteobacteria bacterium 41-28]